MSKQNRMNAAPVTPFCMVQLNPQGDIVRAMRRPDRWMLTNKAAIKLYDQSAPAPVAQPLTRDHVMSALALVPTDMSHPAKCQWIADYLTTPEAAPAPGLEDKEQEQLLELIAEWKSIARVQSAKLHVALDEPGAADHLWAVLQETKLDTPDPVAQPLTDGQRSLLWAKHFGPNVMPQDRQRNCHLTIAGFDFVVRLIECAHGIGLKETMSCAK